MPLVASNSIRRKTFSHIYASIERYAAGPLLRAQHTAILISLLAMGRRFCTDGR
jgi:hypothetical protein